MNLVKMNKLTIEAALDMIARGETAESLPSALASTTSPSAILRSQAAPVRVAPYVPHDTEPVKAAPSPATPSATGDLIVPPRPPVRSHTN